MKRRGSVLVFVGVLAVAVSASLADAQQPAPSPGAREQPAPSPGGIRLAPREPTTVPFSLPTAKPRSAVEVVWDYVKTHPMALLALLAFVFARITRDEDAWGILAIGGAIALVVWGAPRAVKWMGPTWSSIVGTGILLVAARGLYELYKRTPRLFAFTEIAFGAVGLFYGLRSVATTTGAWATVAVGLYGVVEGIGRWKEAPRPKQRPQAKPEGAAAG